MRNLFNRMSTVTRPLRVALVGLGEVAIPHLEAYQDTDKVKVVAGVEPRQERLEFLAETYGFQPYTSLEVMLESEQLDIACVLTPVNTHRKCVETVANAGVHVFCEKPLAVTLDDARAIVAHCQTRRVRLCYGSSYRYLPALRKAKELIASGTLGDILVISEILLGGQGASNRQEMSFAHYPEGGPGGSGMGLVDHGIHMLDLFPWLLSSEVTSVHGRGNISGAKPQTEFAILHFASGAVGHLLYDDASFSSDLPTEGGFGYGWDAEGKFTRGHLWQNQPVTLRIHGTKGALRVFPYGNTVFLTSARGQEQIDIGLEPPPSHFKYQIEAFATALQTHQPAEVGGEVGVKALELLLEIYKPGS
jgi:predicted dehydrogenase